MEAPGEREACPLVNANGVVAAAGRVGGACAQVLRTEAALVDFFSVIAEFLGSATEALHGFVRDRISAPYIGV